VHGVDLSPTAIAWANRKAQESNLRADFRVGNAVTLEGYADEFVDLVLDGSCLQSVIGDDRRMLMTNVLRVLRPGGLFQVHTICGNNEIMELFVQKDGWCYDPQSRRLSKDRAPYYYVGLPEKILQELGEGGFEVLKSEIREAEDGTVHPYVRGDLVVDARKPVSRRINQASAVRSRFSGIGTQ
jgi:ubiquinone/menaquinone biosynthesis C-methylase UbiE